MGNNINKALLYAERLEYVSEVAYKTLIINKKANISKSLIKKHFLRKHGGKSYYYGQ